MLEAEQGETVVTKSLQLLLFFSPFSIEALQIGQKQDNGLSFHATSRRKADGLWRKRPNINLQQLSVVCFAHEKFPVFASR